MHSYSFGIEEEYFVSHGRTYAPVAVMPRSLAREFLKLAYGQVATEMLQTQLEVNTRACVTFEDARDQLSFLRRSVAAVAASHGFVVSASGTHPMAIWHEQRRTQKARYRRIHEDLQIVARRSILCGLHVHVEVPDPDQRITVMRRSLPYLPLLLGLSLASPFWQGHLTGMKGYRLSAYDELPRTGFPPLFSSTQSYSDYVAALVAAGIIPDASHLWWCIRPALNFPTLELRITDSTPRLADTLCVAAWFRCLVRRLCEDETFGGPVTAETLAVIMENRWRIQRFGTQASLVDPATLEVTSATRELAKLAEVLAEDADALGCRPEFDRWQEILSIGTAADQQIAIYERARSNGATRVAGLREVMRWLISETQLTPAGSDAIVLIGGEGGEPLARGPAAMPLPPEGRDELHPEWE